MKTSFLPIKAVMFVVNIHHSGLTDDLRENKWALVNVRLESKDNKEIRSEHWRHLDSWKGQNELFVV